MSKFRMENGRLVRVQPASGDMLGSLVDRRNRLEEAVGDGGGFWDRVDDFVSIPDFGDALDIISRPSYAVQEAIESAIDPNKRGGLGGSALDALVGAGRGLWGTQKTSAIDTLKTHGVDGWQGVALGLTGDILLDPLTYFGAAPIKAAGAAQRTAAGTKALAKTTQTAGKFGDELAEVLYSKGRRTTRAKNARKEATSVINRLNAERTAQGLKPLKGKELVKEHRRITDELVLAREKRLTDAYEKKALRKITGDITDSYDLAKRSKSPVEVARKRLLDVEKSRRRFNMKPLTDRERKKLLRKFSNEEAFSLAKAAQKSAESAVDVNRAGLKLRFGKRSTQITADNPAVARIIDPIKNSTTAKRIVNSDLTQALNKKFRTEGTFGKEFNEARKFKTSGGVAHYDELRQAKIAQAGNLSIDDVVRGLTSKESKEFFRAYELGDLKQLPEFSSKGLRYEDVAKLVKYHMDDFFDTELERGLIPFKRDKNGNILLDEVTGKPVPEVEKLDNYLYHKVTKGSKEYDRLKRKVKAKAVGSDAFAPATERTFKTADDALKHGIEIDTDIRTTLLNRTAKHSQAIARQEFLEDAVSNFGIQIDNSKTLKQMRADGHELVNLKKSLRDVKKGAALEYIPDNVYVPKEIAEHLKGVQSIANDPGPILQLMDKVVQKWKTAATVYNPGHHTRNMISDVALGYMDGVRNPALYARALDIVVNKKTAGHIDLGNGKIRKDQIVKLFHETGASPNFIQTEVANATAGRVGRGVRHVSQEREEVARMAHFLHAIKEEAVGIKHGGEVTQELLDAAARAATRVKKWHIDYSDLTDFEKATMKRVIPFYTWMRKSAPLMVEAMVLRPGKVANIDKSFQAMIQAFGVDPGEQLPTDTIPGWIREGLYGQIGMSARGNPLFATGSALPIAEPFSWVNNGFEGGLRQGLASLNPIAKAPIEIGLGVSTFTGAPMQEGVGNYATGMIPIGRQISQLIKGPTSPEHDKGKMPMFNWLTGLGVQEVTPVSQRGEIRKQIDVLEAKLAEQNKPYPYAEGSRSAPKNRFTWKDGKLVRASG